MVSILFLLIIVCCFSSCISDIDSDFLARVGSDSGNNVGEEEIAAALTEGGNANAMSSGGESLLHLACIWEKPTIIRLLLKFGANPNARAVKVPSSLDMTPLSWCAYAGYASSVAAFLEDSRTLVNMVVRQEDGGLITALDIALKIGTRGSETAQLLRAAGAKTFHQLLEGSSPNDIPDMPPSYLQENLPIEDL